MSNDIGCRCNCINVPGDCEHIWDGPPVMLHNMTTITCSKCGEWRINHDAGVLP